MQHDTRPMSRASSLLLCLLLGPWASGCAEDLTADEADGPAETVETAPDGDAFTTRVDASSSDVWVYFSFETGAQVAPGTPSDSADWDLGFQRFHIISNGGASGSGGAAVATLVDQAFDDVVAAPSDGYVADQPDTDDDDTVVNSAFEEGDGWYDYDQTTNRLSPRALVYVIQTARGAHYKLSILDYYDAAGTSGHPTFAWAEL